MVVLLISSQVKLDYEKVLSTGEISRTRFKNFMRIPNAEHAIVDIRKLQDYCLNPQNEEGKHKAHQFYVKIGMRVDNAEELRDALLQAVLTDDAELGKNDVYGQRYTIDFTLHWHGRQATIRSGIDRGSEVPRLVTAYPL